MPTIKHKAKIDQHIHDLLDLCSDQEDVASGTLTIMTYVMAALLPRACVGAVITGQPDLNFLQKIVLSGNKATTIVVESLRQNPKSLEGLEGLDKVILAIPSSK